MTDLLNNPKRWRQRAKEARTIVTDLTDPGTKPLLQSVSEFYERLAERGDQRTW